VTPRSARKPKSAHPSGKKGPVGRSPKKRVSKKVQPNGPIVLTSAQERFLETIIVEGMTRMRWSRAYAERRARIFLRKANSPSKLRMVAAKLGMLDEAPPAPKPKPLEKKVPGKTKLPKNRFKPSTKMSKAEIAKLPSVDTRPAPKTALQRLERALGPDDGRRRRGGSPVVQGGSPGLGRRR